MGTHLLSLQPWNNTKMKWCVFCWPWMLKTFFSLQSLVPPWIFLSTIMWVLPMWCGGQQEGPAHILPRLWLTRAWCSPVTPTLPAASWMACSVVRCTMWPCWHTIWPVTVWSLKLITLWQVSYLIWGKCAWECIQVWHHICFFPPIQNPAHRPTFKPVWSVNNSLQLFPGSWATSLWAMLHTLTTRMDTTLPVLAQMQIHNVLYQGWCVVQCTVSGWRPWDSSTTALTAPWPHFHQVHSWYNLIHVHIYSIYW